MSQPRSISKSISEILERQLNASRVDPDWVNIAVHIKAVEEELADAQHRLCMCGLNWQKLREEIRTLRGEKKDG